MTSKYFLFFAVSLASASRMAAGAITLSDAVYETRIGEAFYDTPGTYSDTGESATLTAYPLINLQASSGGNSLGGFNSSAHLTYSFAVTGATAGQVIPLLMQVSLSTTASKAVGDNFSSGAEVSVTTADGTQTVETGSNVGLPSSWSGVIAFNYIGMTGVNFVNLFVSTLGDFGSSTASADPYIYVDPSFANAGSYAVIVSPGVANSPSSTTPEPAPFALVGLTLCGAAVLRYRKHRR